MLILVMNTTRIENFPAAKLEAAREAIAAVHKRLARAAERAGQSLPELPVIEVAGEHEALRCTAIGITACGRTPAFGATPLSECPVRSCPGVVVAVPLVELDVTMSRPSLAGWEFLAVVEPLVGGNLIKKVPGADAEGVDFAPWRDGAVVCDHCATKRNRKETFLVRADGTDAAIAAGTLKQVGRQCLADFLGGLSPAAIVSRMTYVEAVREVGEGGEGGGGFHDTTLDPGEFLTWTSAVVRLDGWVSKGAASASFDEKVATVSTVSYLLTPPFGAGRAKWSQDRAKYAPTPADAERGEAVLAWARALEGSSDYERNLSLVAKQPRTERRHTGILGSAISAYERSVGNDLRRAREAAARAASTHQGEVGKRVVLALTVERVADIDTQYGTLHIHTMRDAGGNAYIWKTGSARLEPGKAVTGKCTVKAHSEYRGEAQTELSRCNF